MFTYTTQWLTICGFSVSTKTFAKQYSCKNIHLTYLLTNICKKMQLMS